mmetsp:Transcript_37401/g.67268  ORF Transcript_37401/g.67268 Transcript_37401/m.67268 type:complete len:122 (+) Transcript_37401:195-560(+)
MYGATPEITKSFVLYLYLAMQFLPLLDLSVVALVSKSCRESIITQMIVQAAYREQKQYSCLPMQFTFHPQFFYYILPGKKCELCFSEHKTLPAWSFGGFACLNCVSERSDCLSKCWNTTCV